MLKLTASSPHQFHIPVMGTGFTVDTPLKVAKYGLSSVISLLDDVLIEQMRKYHSFKNNLPYKPIRNRDHDYRAGRITSYLELVDHLVKNQVAALQASRFEPGSEITRYFELLPDSSLRNNYHEMLNTADPVERIRRQDRLRPLALPGPIDVNIMTKVDKDVYKFGEKLPKEFSEASSALRGYANSPLKSSIIFSAGFNPRLFEYLTNFEEFYPAEDGVIKKKITLKVGDFRSALIQGKYLARKGLWVSEFRIESGLNCGGHAFAAEGSLLGPILEEFRNKRQSLLSELHEIFSNALLRSGRPVFNDPLDIKITVQGGVGTFVEHKFLLDRYDIDATGWGTPFLLVPEVTNVDNDNLEKLQAASERDIFLSDSSPLGIPFWNLRESASEVARRARLTAGKPGSKCPKGFASSNTEFTRVPICTASYGYQRLKLKQLDTIDCNGNRESLENQITDKSCICHDLAGGATIKNNIDSDADPAICAGPNIVNFSKIASLEEMISHIYGRINLITNSERPNMFLKEMKLNIEHFQREFQKSSKGLIERTSKYFQTFKCNLQEGVEYYRKLADEFGAEQKEKFLHELETLRVEIENLLPGPVVSFSNA